MRDELSTKEAPRVAVPGSYQDREGSAGNTVSISSDPVTLESFSDQTQPSVTQLELSIVMPCLNEAETLAVCIRKAQSYLQRSGVRGEVVIGDNGSTDGSQEIARSMGAHVIDVPNRGCGAALFGAFASARGRYCIMGDSDDSYDFENLDLFVDKLREGYDFVIGNRFKGGIKKGTMPC